MQRLPRTVGTISVVVGALAIVLGGVMYYVVHKTLADEKITVSADAPFLAGDEVDGPFSAYAEAMAINQHALNAGAGKTYAEIPQGDPTRDTVMTADFLQASLFTSVVAFGVCALVMALGVMFILTGLAFRSLDARGAKAGAIDLRDEEPTPAATDDTPANATT